MLSSAISSLQPDARIDLLVTDVGLPGDMNGRQMADVGRERQPNLKVLFITDYAENAVLGNGYLHPGMQVLTKPFVLETLATRIEDLIAESQVSPHDRLGVCLIVRGDPGLTQASSGSRILPTVPLG